MSHYKRSRSNVDSDDENRSSSNFSKRRKCAESMDEVEKRLETIICKIGEKAVVSLETCLESVAKVLELDSVSYKQQILEIIMLCSYQIPEKCSIYTTLTGLLNKTKSDFGSDLIDILMPELKRLIATNQFQYGLNMIRFLSDLCNCYVVKPYSLLALLNSFVSVCKQEGSPQTRNDWYVYATLSALPWVGAVLQQECPDELEVLFIKIQQYIGKRSKTHHDLLRVWDSTDERHPQEEYLDCLHAQIKNLREHNWTEEVIFRPYKAFENDLKQSFQHNIPQFVIPPHIEDKSLYPKPQAVFRMFDYTDCPEGMTLPGNQAIERWLLEDSVRNMIRSHYTDKKECANRLQTVFESDQIPANYILVEVLFGELFRLPHPDHPLVFYTSVFIELCKLQPNKMPQVLALGTELLFERLDHMNVTCIDRFVNWFSHHLSNFQFSWTWDDWKSCLQSDLASPRPKFIKEVLEKCMRLSYYSKIPDVVPGFEALYPAEPVINFKYADEIESNQDSKMAFTPAQKIVASLRKKANSEDIKVVLEQQIPSYGPEGEAVVGFEIQRVEVFTQCLLNLARKSFSHSFSALSRYHKVLKWTATEKEAKAEILRVTRDVWRYHPQMIAVLVDKMLRLQIVTCSSVAEWIFSTDMAVEFTRVYVWEILHNTIRRMEAHLQRVQREHQEIKEKSETHDTDPNADNADSMMGTFNAFSPDEKDVKNLNVQINAAEEQQKILFLTIFQNFIFVLTQHLEKCKAEGTDHNNPWYKITLDRLKEVFLLHGHLVRQYAKTLGQLLFTDELDSRIKDVFEQYVAIAC